jgi:type IV pilus secretin PilQ/predicted competence protein
MIRKIYAFQILLIVATLQLCCATLLAQQTEQTGLVTINLKDVAFANVLKVLSEKTGLKFVADPDVQDRRISVSLNNVSSEEAITAIMNSNNMGYRLLEGTDIYVVSDIRKIQRETTVRQIRLQFADAVELQNTLNKIVTPGVGVVVADQRTNTVILRDNAEALHRLEELIKSLDTPTPQIYVQAAIAEISLTKDRSSGLEWLWKNPNLLSNQDKIGTRFDLRPITNQPQYFDNAGQRLGIGLPSGLGLGIGIINKSFDAVLQALQVEKDVNILSRPYLITLDNKEAVIEVGDQIPYKVLNQYGITSYEFKAATIKLRVRAHINNDNTITVEVTPNADFQNGQTPDGIPIIARRMANTTIKIGNNQTIVIGGLMRETNSTVVSRVPLLGAIPLLGRLFSSRSNQLVKTELVVFINPTIVTDKLIKTQLQPEKILSEPAQEKIEELNPPKK